MKTAVDTNIFSRILLGRQNAMVAWEALSACRVQGSLVVSPVVYAEMLANRIVSTEQVEVFLREAEVRVDWLLRNSVWLRAGERFRAYAERRRASGGGEARRLIADFVVGAHASIQADRLLTFDTSVYRTHFPELNLVSVI